MATQSAPPQILTRIPLLWRVTAVVLLLSTALAWIIWERMGLLQSGREVLLQSVPVDPRDLLRGDYVILSYDFSRIDTRELPTHSPRPFGRNDRAFLRLKRADDGFWRAVSLNARKPQNLSPDEAVIAAWVHRVHAPWKKKRHPDEPPEAPCQGVCQIVYLRFGIEKYFVPEGAGKALERERDQRKLGIIAKLSPSGQAVIAGLQIDGRKLYEEPLF